VRVIPTQVRAAAGIVAAEALALLSAAGVLAVKTATQRPDSYGRALLDMAFALGGALLLGFGAWGLIRLKPAARTPVIVLQLLALPVAYSLAFQANRVEYGGPILVAALATLYLLFTPQAREALDRHID
jgi:hypothetical protein